MVVPLYRYKDQPLQQLRAPLVHVLLWPGGMIAVVKAVMGYYDPMKVDGTLRIKWKFDTKNRMCELPGPQGKPLSCWVPRS